MEVTITTQFNKGDRVWMPDGDGGMIKGRVVSIVLVRAELTLHPSQIAMQSLNYHCIDERGDKWYFHEYQLQKR